MIVHLQGQMANLKACFKNFDKKVHERDARRAT